MPRLFRSFATATCLLATSAAHAVSAIPALYLETRLFSLWSVALAWAIAVVLVRRLYALGWGRSLAVALLAKVIATVAGAVLMPVAGFAWEAPAPLYRNALGWAGFDLISWAFTLLFACLLYAAVDALVYRYVWRLRTPRRIFLWICAANVVSVALAFASLYLAPVE